MLDRKLLDESRFHLDDPSLFNFDVNIGEPDSTVIHSRFLSRHVRVSDSLFPSISECIRKATSWLLGNKEVHAFISADESMNATCIPGVDDVPIIWLSSGLVKTLSDDELLFVIGHELGHWYYRHYQYPLVDPESGPRFVARQQLSRAAEVSADRFGLIACQDLEASLRAVLKTASGLTDDYLGRRVSEFVAQARSLTAEKIDRWEVYATHPPMVIRARALLWFSMTGKYEKITGNKEEGLGIDSVNSKVEKDLFSVLGHEFTEKRSKEMHEAVFWMTVFEITKDGELSKADQALIEHEFGDENLLKLKNFLKGKNSTQVNKELRDKAFAAQEVIKAYSKYALNQFLEKHSEAAVHAKKFITQFSQ